MGQREDVTASLLASHGVDAVARRKVAEKVSQVVVVAAGDVGVATAKASGLIGDGKMREAKAQVQASLRQVATAASAVVLASDLRAPQSAASPSDPVDGICRIILPTFDRLNEDGRDGLRGFVRRVAQMRDSSNRQDWRARLANVERLLLEGMDDAGTSTLPYHRMRDALAEVRSLLGGE